MNKTCSTCRYRGRHRCRDKNGVTESHFCGNTGEKVYDDTPACKYHKG